MWLNSQKKPVKAHVEEPSEFSGKTVLIIFFSVSVFSTYTQSI